MAPDFTAEFELDDRGNCGDADLYVEAYHKQTSQRFTCGTAGAPIPPEDSTLDQIDLSGPILFRVKVVDNRESVGRLIASADGLRPEGEDAEDQRSSLLIFRSTPHIGQQTWKLSFGGELPVLSINSRIPEAKAKLSHNPMFQGLVLPAAFREILMFIFWESGNEIEDDTWQSEWLEFAKTIFDFEAPDVDDASELLSWIDDVIAAFSSKHEICDRLVGRMKEES